MSDARLSLLGRTGGRHLSVIGCRAKGTRHETVVLGHILVCSAAELRIGWARPKSSALPRGPTKRRTRWWAKRHSTSDGHRLRVVPTRAVSVYLSGIVPCSSKNGAGRGAFKRAPSPPLNLSYPTAFKLVLSCRWQVVCYLDRY